MYGLFNARCDILRDVFFDDAYGGAVASGTTIYSFQECRLDYYEPKIGDTKKQGIETEKTFSLYLHDNRQNQVDIRELDVVIMTFPPLHPYYNQRFRVRGVQRESTHRESRFGIIEVTLTRIDITRTSDSF